MSRFSKNIDQKWYLIYFALVFFDLVAMGGSMLLNSFQTAKYHDVLASSSQMFNLFEEMSKLAELAQRTNAPGNDVFDSLDAQNESLKQTQAAEDFYEQLAKVEREYLLILKEVTPSEKERLFEANAFTEEMIQTRNSLERMLETSVLIFQEFAQENRSAAGQHMAEMDRRYGKLMLNIENLRRAVIQRQGANLQGHFREQEELHRYEMLLAMLIFFCILGAVLYGSKMSRFVKGIFKQAEFNKRILDAINEVAIVAYTDSKGRITEVNKNFCRVSGFERNELIGKTHKMVNSGVHPQAFFRDMWATISSGKNWTGDIENRNKNGGHYYVRTVVSPIFNENGAIERYIAIRFDVTEQKNAERSLNEERVKSLRNAKLASLGEMCAGVAHEINNPLAIINGAAHVLPKFINNQEKLRERITQIQDACERITRIVKSLKKFSRSDEHAERTICALSGIVNESVVLTSAKARRHMTAITIECSHSLKIFCDEIEIEQVLVNLINNGIDAVKNKDQRWLHISAFKHKNSVVLRITDSGDGISKDAQARLFQPFFTTKPVGQGTGLGLSIVRGIIEDHAATIDLVTDEPHTCFEIRFCDAEEKKIEV